MSTSSTKKDTIYVDVDDEITTVIEKVTSSPQKIVALVLPKRATVLQSVVNMKLLKRSAAASEKNLVLITSEAGLLPLAGAVGLHVAKTPQSKPAIPVAPAHMKDEPETIEEADDYSEADFDANQNAARPIGDLADDSVDTIELDNAEESRSSSKAAGAAAGGVRLARGDKSKSKDKDKPSKPKKGKDKKLKVPDIGRFRNKVLIGVAALVLLIAGWIFAAVVLPKAQVAIKTDSQDIQKTIDLKLDTTATEVDAKNTTIPAVRAQVTKTTQQEVAASGTDNLGKRAEGGVVFTICASSPAQVNDIPAGTGVSTGGKNYITQERASFSFSQGQGCGGNAFRFRSSQVEIRAQAAGSEYNVRNADFTVAGSAATGSGSATGGTDEIVKIVAQSDIDSATQKLTAAEDQSAVTELEANLKNQDMFAIKESLNKSTPEITATAKAGDRVDSVTVTQRVTYNMMGVKRSQLDELVKDVVSEDIDTERQTILDTGVDKATFGLQNQANESEQVVVSMRVTALAGPDLDKEKLAEEIAGKKSAEAEALIKKYPGMVDVRVTYSPFWVSSVPGNVDKITITLEK